MKNILNHMNFPQSYIHEGPETGNVIKKRENNVAYDTKTYHP